MDQFLYTVYTVSFIVLTVYCLRLYGRTRHVGTGMLVIVNASMVYENGVLAAGVLIGHGPLLESLSWLRFIGYAVIPPLLVMTGLGMVQRSGAAWATRREVTVGAWLVTLGLAVFALLVEVVGRQLEPRILNDVVRYMWVTRGVPPLGVILMDIILIGFGIVILRKTQQPLLLIGAIVMLVGAGVSAGKYVIGSGFELIFMTILTAAEVWLIAHLPAQAPTMGRQFAQQAVGD